jgi:hypothetical protein
MQNLLWNKTGDLYYLESPSEKLVQLHYEPANKISFRINDESYELKRTGFWNQRYTVYKNNQVVVKLSHNFWGSTGKINFSDGTQYMSDYKNKNTLALRLLDGESEILSYQEGLEDGKRKAILLLGVALVDAEKILLLATLGMVMFLNIFNEFKDEGDDAGFLLLATAAS